MTDGSKNQPSTLTRIAISFAAALLVVGATWLVRHPNDATRGLASTNSPARRTDMTKQNRIDAHTQAHSKGELHGKVTGTFSVEIQHDSKNESEEIHLRGVVHADRAVSGHEFSWILPEGYRVLSGLSSGQIPNLGAGETHSMTLVLKRETSNRKPIVLHVFKLVDSEPKGQVAQYDDASNDELSIQKAGQSHKPASVPFLRGETIVQ